jgi:hypothetical protein
VKFHDHVGDLMVLLMVVDEVATDCVGGVCFVEVGVAADCVGGVCFVEIGVVADGSLIEGSDIVVEAGLDSDQFIPPFLRKSLPAICREIQVAHNPCH